MRGVIQAHGLPVIADGFGQLSGLLGLRAQHVLRKRVLTLHRLQASLQGLGLRIQPKLSIQRAGIGQRRILATVQAQGAVQCLPRRIGVALTVVEHTQVVPDRGERAILHDRGIEERAGADEVSFGHAFGTSIVVEMRQCTRAADRLRAVAVVEYVAIEVDRGVTPRDLHARVDVAHTVDHAGVLVLVPGHDLADFLDAGLDASLARQCHEHQREGEAVGAALLPDFVHGVGRVRVVLQVQPLAAEDHFHQCLQPLLAR